MATFGVLTGGGDCPGLNAVIRAVVRRGVADGHRLIGFHGGWIGIRDDDAVELTLENTAGIVTRGGTILGTSRFDPMADGAPGLEALRATLRRRDVEALAVIGGDGTLGAARELWQTGFPLVTIPKTIDNDVAGTDFSVGFQTAVQIATEAIDRLHTTAESHNRVMVVEVMGRRAGWIAASAGLASGADVILVPERPFRIEEVCDQLRARHRHGRRFSIVVVAEGAFSDDGSIGLAVTPDRHASGDTAAGVLTAHPRSLAAPSGIAFLLRDRIEALTGFDTKVTVLGHVQRGGTPVAFDRILASRFGVAAAEAMLDGQLGMMMALRGARVIQVDLEEVLAHSKPLDPDLYRTASVFFG
ncbi:MAG TPA: ATP-dependent 6-phosphofructokinase [Solirubrobacteraceae bacterium]|nr:ATP-dependent 6-phosphofructokinase [Solirubrobacteraceae bacterium]